MPKHVWTVVCRKVVQEPPPALGQMSLLDVIQTLTLHSKEPIGRLEAGKDIFIQVEMQVVTLWARSRFNQPETAKCRYRLMLPNGRLFRSPTEMSVDLESTTGTRTTLNISAFPFKGLGTYHWIVQLKSPRNSKTKRTTWAEVARIPLEMVLSPHLDRE